MTETQLTRLEQAIVETHKPQGGFSNGDEVIWHVRAAGCKCKPSSGVNAGICRPINETCNYEFCPRRPM